MANGNVISFPGGNGGNAGFGRAFPPNASASAGVGATPEPTPPQAGGPVQLPPIATNISARLTAALNLARDATTRLVGRAVPGTVELGLFNQFGIIQNALAQLATRMEQATGDAELQAIAKDLEDVEQQTNNYVAAVDAAVANSPIMAKGTNIDSRKLLWIAAGLGTIAFGTGLWLFFRKPARRKSLAGFFLGTSSSAAPAAALGGGKKRKRSIKRST